MKKHLREVDRAVESIRELTVRQVLQSYPGSGKQPVREVRTPVIELMLGRARMVLLAAEVPSGTDGYSPTTPGNGSPGGGKGGGRRMSVDFIDDDGVRSTDLLPTSSTEAAAIDARWSGPDPVAKVGRNVNRLLLQVADGLRQLERELDNFDGLRSTAKVPDPPMCWVAQVRYKLPFDVAWEPIKTTDFAGVLDPPLDEPRKVSSFVYWYTRRTKELPSRQQMLDYLAGSTVKRRA